MINYNDNSLIVGYIKQLLESFNLPTAKVYKNDESSFNNCIYIKDNKLCKCNIDDDNNYTFSNIALYDFGKKINNFTRTLPLKNNIYDEETHIQLGNYLRFLRDYKKLNLMFLYNCFSNRTADKLSIDSIGFDTTDTGYKIYMVPVKFNCKYQIHLESFSPIEIACGFYDEHYYEGPLDTHTEISTGITLPTLTYQKVGGCMFRKGITYDKLLINTLSNHTTENYTKAHKEFFSEIIQHEDSLKMFIKVPFENNSSVVVLEYTDGDTNVVINTTRKLTNGELPYTINNVNNSGYTLLSSSQLLKVNSNVSHPFSDRLIEYITDNAITHLDTISDNIYRMQLQLRDCWEKSEGKIGINNNEYLYKGIWDAKYPLIIYNYAVVKKINSNKDDVIGYDDKDIEKSLGQDPDIYSDSWYQKEGD